MQRVILDWSLIAAIATMVAWGMNFVFVKYVLDNLGFGAFMFLRFLVLPLLGLALLVIIFRHRIAHTWPKRADLPRFLLCALVGHVIHISAVMYGMNLSTAFSSSLVLTCQPLFTLAILAWLGAERLRGQQIAGTLLAFAGISLFLADKFAAGFSRAGLGDLTLLVAGASFSAYTVLSRPLADRYGPLIVLSYTLLFSMPLMLALTYPFFADLKAASYGPAVWAAIFWALVVCSFCGWLVWTWVNSVRGIARSAPFMYLMPPVAGVMAWLTLGETFTWAKILGAAVTMAGVAWAQFGGGHPPPKETGQADSA
ncbi:MAG TPA: DMT family transporter [Burkholderiales bacterium]|nr:DMT family transporter [Burkholderiales bacterium]